MSLTPSLSLSNGCSNCVFVTNDEAVCELDIMQVLDSSWSMSGDKIVYLKESMHIFINDTPPDGSWSMGIVWFNITAGLAYPLTNINSDLIRRS